MSDVDGSEDYISLGKFHLSGIRKAAVGEANIDVTFAIDRNGILHVSAMDIDTGIQNEIEINGVGYLSKQQQLFRRGKNLKVI